MRSQNDVWQTWRIRSSHFGPKSPPDRSVGFRRGDCKGNIMWFTSVSYSSKHPVTSPALWNCCLLLCQLASLNLLFFLFFSSNVWNSCEQLLQWGSHSVIVWTMCEMWEVWETPQTHAHYLYLQYAQINNVSLWFVVAKGERRRFVLFLSVHV